MLWISYKINLPLRPLKVVDVVKSKTQTTRVRRTLLVLLLLKFVLLEMSSRGIISVSESPSTWSVL